MKKCLLKIIIFCYRYEVVREIFAEMKKCYPDREINWLLVHDAGCTIDDSELPHHVTSPTDLDRFIGGVFRSFLSIMPATPVSVTMAR